MVMLIDLVEEDNIEGSEPAIQGVITTICPVLPSATDILIPHTTHEWKMGMADHICLYMRPFTTRNQVIKTPEKVDQVIKQASRD